MFFQPNLACGLVEPATISSFPIVMDFSRYAADPSAINALTEYQIARFFRRHSFITEAECRHVASRLTGGNVSPTPVQGQFSYTVVSDTEVPRVVQFRDTTLDLGLIDQAKKTYKDIVPICELHTTIKGVYIYEMECINGVAFSLARSQLFRQTMEARLFQTVQDMARSVISIKQLESTDRY
jgi:hypothetical protein